MGSDDEQVYVSILGMLDRCCKAYPALLGRGTGTKFQSLVCWIGVVKSIEVPVLEGEHQFQSLVCWIGVVKLIRDAVAPIAGHGFNPWYVG